MRPGPAKHELVEAGTRFFLLKVTNLAGVTARLQAKSSNALLSLNHFPSINSPAFTRYWFGGIKARTNAFSAN